MRAVVETVTLTARALREIRRAPTRIIFPILIPIMQLVLPPQSSEGDAAARFPSSSSLDFPAPGNVALAVVVGAGGAGFQMVQDIDTGFFDKLRVAPINRSSIVAGLLATDAFRYALHALVVALVAVAIGAKLATGVLGMLVIMLLGGLYGAAWSGTSRNALRTRSPEVTAATGIRVPAHLDRLRSCRATCCRRGCAP